MYACIRFNFNSIQIWYMKFELTAYQVRNLSVDLEADFYIVLKETISPIVALKSQIGVVAGPGKNVWQKTETASAPGYMAGPCLHGVRFIYKIWALVL